MVYVRRSSEATRTNTQAQRTQRTHTWWFCYSYSLFMNIKYESSNYKLVTRVPQPNKYGKQPGTHTRSEISLWFIVFFFGKLLRFNAHIYIVQYVCGWLGGWMDGWGCVWYNNEIMKPNYKPNVFILCCVVVCYAPRVPIAHASGIHQKICCEACWADNKVGCGLWMYVACKTSIFIFKCYFAKWMAMGVGREVDGGGCRWWRMCVWNRML